MPTLTVAALRLLLVFIFLQQLHIVTAHQAAHVGHALVGDFYCASVEKFSKWITGGKGCVYNPEKLFTIVGLHC